MVHQTDTAVSSASAAKLHFCSNNTKVDLQFARRNCSVTFSKAIPRNKTKWWLIVFIPDPYLQRQIQSTCRIRRISPTTSGEQRIISTRVKSKTFMYMSIMKDGLKKGEFQIDI